jgi:hypothetical protein
VLPVKVFCSYSHEDCDLIGTLKQHLSPLERTNRIEFWSDDKLLAGVISDPAIHDELAHADLILILLSASYCASEYCWNIELNAATKLGEQGRARVVPILLRDVMWNVPPINKYNIIPKYHGKLLAVTSWKEKDEAFAEVAREINRVVDDVEDHLSRTRPDLINATHPILVAKSFGSTVFHCIPKFNEHVQVRSTGITEMVPDLVLHFDDDPGEHRFVDLWLYANTIVTSRIIGAGNLSEANLLVATGQNISGLPTLRHCLRAVQSGSNALAFLHVPLHELRSLPRGERNLRIANVRVNAAVLGEGATIQLYLKVSETTVAPTPQLGVALVGTTFHTHVVSADLRFNLSRLLQSRSMNVGLLEERRAADSLTALLTCAGHLAGYEPPGERTRIRLAVANFPNGVSLFVTTQQVTSKPGKLSATLVAAADAFGNGPVDKTSIDGHVTVDGRSLALSKIDMQAGRGFVTWELDGGLSEDTQTVILGLVLVYRSDLSRHLPELGTATLSVTLAPSGGPLAGIQTPNSDAPIPRFVDTSLVQPFFCIAC